MTSFAKHLVRMTLLDKLLVTRGREGRGQVALTFDDGPDPDVTPRVLEILQRHSAQATFFLIGCKVESSPEILQRMLQDGHEVGNHSQTHAEFSGLSLDRIRAEFDDCERVLRTAGVGQAIIRARPPKGLLSARSLMAAALDRRRYAMWNRDPKDYAMSSAHELIDYFRRAPLRDGDIVLLHDVKDSTATALETLLDDAKSSGLTPVKLSQICER